MNNVFYTDRKIDLRYDLKGSTLGRLTITNSHEPIDPTIALKDNDFTKRKEKFKVGGEMKSRLMEVIRKDVQFFTENHIIDYSLLVGVHTK